MGNISDKFEWFSADDPQPLRKYKQPISYGQQGIGTVVSGAKTAGGDGGVTNANRKKWGRNLAQAKHQAGKS